MRWYVGAQQAPGRFTGEIAAVPVTLLSREEEAFAHHRQGRHHGASAPAARRTYPSKTPPPRISAPPAKLPDHHKRPLLASPNETIRLGATVVVTPRTLADSRPPGISARGLTPRSPEDASVPGTADVGVTTKFLVCAGRAMTVDSPRSNNDDDREPTGLPTATTPTTTAATAMTSNNSEGASSACETPRGTTQRALQRSDSELELIISELREKIALQQQQQQRSQSPQTDDDGGSRHGHHSRKHLKNPVEKMSLATSASSTGVQLRRQASASQVHATRLVREGSATMVTPVVLANSASRSAFTHSGGGGGGTQAPGQGTGLHTIEPHVRDDSQSIVEPAEGFRIRAYDTTTAPSNPAFTSSTSLGQNLPTTLPSPPRVTTNNQSVPLHTLHPTTSRPRARTLVDLDLELDRLYGFDGDDGGAYGGGDSSPVGPWARDQDCSGPLASSRSTASLASSGSVGELALASPECTADLSPRSRLLWLSDCCGDDAWATPSVRVMAMLRPGSYPQRDLARRPASAVELRRRHSKSKSAGTPGKTRAKSAKAYAPNVMARRTSTDSSGGPLDAASKPPAVKAPSRVAQRPRSGSGSSVGSGSSSNTSGRGLFAPHQRGSFRT